MSYGLFTVATLLLTGGHQYMAHLLKPLLKPIKFKRMPFFIPQFFISIYSPFVCFIFIFL